MSEIPNRLLRSFEAARQLVVGLASSPFPRSSRAVFSLDTEMSLANAVAAGQLTFGTRVRGQGWLSPYAYWHLPDGYSPYHFATAYAADGHEQALIMQAAPAFLPAGEIPFKPGDL